MGWSKSERASLPGGRAFFCRIGGEAPAGVAGPGTDVWCAAGPDAERVPTALGLPVGHGAFVCARLAERLADEEPI